MNTLRNNSLLASAQSIFVRFLVAFALGLAMASTATMSAQAADYQWFGPTAVDNGGGTFTVNASYTSNYGVAFKTGASGPYRMQWVKLNLTSGLASSNITVKLSLRDTTNSTAYSAVAGANEYAVDTLNITTPTTANTPFTLNLDPTTIPNIAAYTMSADTSYALILNGASANLAIRRTNGYLPNTTNNYYTLNDGFTVLNTFKNTAIYMATSTNYPSLHFFFGTWQVTYDANNATSGAATSSQPKYAGVDLTLAANSGTLARTGYTFAGWNTAAIGDGTDYAAGATYSAEASPTLYAKWAAANTIPTVTAISPTSGSTLGGSAVTITGTDLTGASAVTIGGAACTSMSVVSATSITCTTPPGTAWIASVLVTTSGGTNAANTLFTYITPNFIAKLNDSGVTQCTNGTALVACSAANIGNGAAYPRQDARFGRDAAQAEGKLLPAKTGGGAAGFDFTPLDAAGNAIALTGTPPVPSATPTCVHDNVTNLTWEVKTTSGLRNKTNTYTWYNGTTGTLGVNDCGGTLSAYANQCNTNNYALAVNAAGLCGAHSPWRVPSRRELLSIVHHGTSISPAIDPNYFPNTDSFAFWTSDVNAFIPAKAWRVYFDDGGASADSGSDNSYRVRLVRSGQ